MDIYQRRRIPTVVNGTGTLTRTSGDVMRAEVAAAMVNASTHITVPDLLRRRSNSF